MDIPSKNWTHDWAHFNFIGVTLAADDNADGISTLSVDDIKEYLIWLAIYNPQKYGQLMLGMISKRKRITTGQNRCFRY